MSARVASAAFTLASAGGISSSLGKLSSLVSFSFAVCSAALLTASSALRSLSSRLKRGSPVLTLLPTFTGTSVTMPESGVPIAMFSVLASIIPAPAI